MRETLGITLTTPEIQEEVGSRSRMDGRMDGYIIFGKKHILSIYRWEKSSWNG
jgi:hypothetical protein